MRTLLILPVVATLALPGCITPQNDTVRSLSYSQAAKAIPKGSTKDHVRSVLGKPSTVNSRNGEEMWSYVDQKLDLGKVISPFTPWTKGVDTKAIVIFFNRNGRVKQVTQNTFNL